jgi:hypothetical protein
MSLHVCVDTGPSVLPPCSMVDPKWPYYGPLWPKFRVFRQYHFIVYQIVIRDYRPLSQTEGGKITVVVSKYLLRQN